VKHLYMVALAVVAVAWVISAVGATTASATCRRALVATEATNFNSRSTVWKSCNDRLQVNGAYSKIATGWRYNNNGFWCYHVELGTDFSAWANDTCEGAAAATGGYFRSSEGPPSGPFYTSAGTVDTIGKGNQTFTLANKNKIVCGKASGSTSIPEAELEVLYTPLKYSECTAFGKDKAEFGSEEETFFSSGLLGFPSVKSKIEIATAKCSVILGAAPTYNELLSTIKYANLSNGKLEALATIEGLVYEVSATGASECGTGKAIAGAKLEGKYEIEGEGSTIKVE
jgi:hypothetical protein